MWTHNEGNVDSESAIVFRQDLLEIVISQEEKIELNKLVGGIDRIAHDSSKPESCHVCGSATFQLCSSHTIPRYCLQEIADDGMLYAASALLETNLLKAEIGVNEAAIFRCICRKCDTEYFKLYETPSTLLQAPSSRIMGQIAAKNLLREISKARHSISKNRALEDKSTSALSTMANVRAVDLEEDEAAFRIAVRVGKSSSGSKAYHLVFHRVLPYVAPFAFQQMVSPIADCDGSPINYSFNPNPDYRMEPIHICVLPSKGNTVVMMFRGERGKRYREFERQFRLCNDDEQLEIIVKLIFAYSEDVFISKKINPAALMDSNLKTLARMNHNYSGFGSSDYAYKKDVQLAAVRDFSIANLPKPPGLLLKSYALSSIDRSSFN
ncbi:MAG: hypothetical protein FWG00_01595 [Coriobacteriia bacterium]|nr:hypothetical protein [Coriobacteriia bacterium]